MDSGSDMFEEIASWGTGQLKDFLQVRGLLTGGNRKELVSRAYVAWEQKADIRLSEKDLQARLQDEYSSRLKQHALIDPRSISTELWVSDCTQWPKLDLGKVFAYLIEQKDQDVDFVGKYKTHKAYSYFSSGFVDIIHSYKHGGITILKTKVTPSMSIRKEAHEVWIAIDHATADIQCCWCTCIAGFAQTCNHVVAAMYKVEYATTMGYTDPACTSIPCSWNKSTRKNVQPSRIADMNIRQDSRLKKSYTLIQSASKINSESKRQFDPRRFDERTVSGDAISVLLGKIHSTKPTAVVFKTLPKTHSENELPATIPDLAKSHKSKGGLTNNFLETLSLSFTDSAVNTLEVNTRAQADNQEWIEQRKGRLTSSIHHDIYTKMATLNKGGKNKKVSPLIAKVFGKSKDVSNLPALKWGREMEKKALNDFTLEETLKHTNFTVSNCGLFVKKDRPYISCSPDAMCVCRCCGKATIEIKCPFVLANPQRSVQNGYKDVSFLELNNDKLQIKKTHQYYTQIQAQMAITGCKRAYFVVWSPAGKPFIELLSFDSCHWQMILQSLIQFYSAYVLDFLFSKRELSFCPVCNNVCLSEQEITEKSDNSVCCNTCDLWYHWPCAGVQKEPAIDSWYCPSCQE